MALLERDREPSASELRYFGLMFAAFFALVGAFVQRRTGRLGISLAIWVSAAAITVAYYLVPQLRRILFRVWMTVTFPLGWAVSHVVLGFFYFAVFTPIGWLLRTFVRDPMQRKIEPERPTYWIERGPPREPGSYWRQF